MSASAQTHYDTLGVARQAAPELVRKAYRRQAQKYHPDRLPGDAGAQQVMARINEAYAVLSDPARRATYDRWVDARQARIDAEQAALRAANSALEATWPWYLLCATIAFALLSVATVLYKASVPPIAPPNAKVVTAKVVTQAATR
jgi:curved DNA-binding protein CbpA